MKRIKFVVTLSLLLVITLDQCQATVTTKIRKEMAECKARAFCYFKCNKVQGCLNVARGDNMGLICAENNDAEVEISLGFGRAPFRGKRLAIVKHYRVNHGECEAFFSYYNNSSHQYTIKSTTHPGWEKGIIPAHQRTAGQYDFSIKYSRGTCGGVCGSGERIL